MASIKIFRNETPTLPITVEPVVWVTPEERLDELWQIARERILGDGSVPSDAPQPTGGICNAQSTDEIADRISAQDEASTHLRRKSRQRNFEVEQSGDETLRSGAEQKIIRLGVRERVVDQTQTVMAAMVTAQKGADQDRIKVQSKSSAQHGRSRGLLHPGNLISPRVEQADQLGPSRTVVMRAQGEHNNGSRVIA